MGKTYGLSFRTRSVLTKDKASRLEPNIRAAAKKLVCLDTTKWQTYVPQPVQFADFATEGVEENLDFIINSINENGVWSPNWAWGQYENIWQEQKVKWEGVLAIQNLKILAAFNRMPEVVKHPC